MPKISLGNPGIHESVTRPVILDITRQLFALTGIDPETQILYPGDTTRAKQPGSAIDGNNDPDFSNATTPFSARMFVEVDENHENDRMLTTAVFDGENLPVFRDDLLETVIVPVYSTHEVVINFRFRAQDKTQAERWRNEMRAKTAMRREQMLHSLTYNYLLPPEFVVILQEIHRLRENVAPYGQTFEQWFAAQASSRVSTITTLAGTSGAYSVSEKQQRVQGYFDFEGVPEKGEKDSEGETWFISFSYKFKYEKPVDSAMAYPLMVHNQLIAYRPEEPKENTPDLRLRSYSQTGLNLRFFEQGTKLLGISDGVAIPPFDEFIPDSIPVDTLRVFTALCSVDTAEAGNPRLLMNLNDLGGNVALHPAVLRFLQGETTYLTGLYQSVFHLNLYQGVYLLPSSKVSINSDLDVLATGDLDLRSYYHVRLSLIEDLDLLAPHAATRLRQNADVLALILIALGAEMCIPPTLGANFVGRGNYNAAVNCSNAAKLSRGDGQPRQFNTVMNLIINSLRAQDHASR